jgi:hypothetical protein
MSRCKTCRQPECSISFDLVFNDAMGNVTTIETVEVDETTGALRRVFPTDYFNDFPAEAEAARQHSAGMLVIEVHCPHTLEEDNVTRYRKLSASEWADFRAGRSIFIPGVTLKEVGQHLQEAADKLNALYGRGGAPKKDTPTKTYLN